MTTATSLRTDEEHIKRIRDQRLASQLNNRLAAPEPAPQPSGEHHSDGLHDGSLAAASEGQSHVANTDRNSSGHMTRCAASGSGVRTMRLMEGSTEVRSWLRCYRCWSQNLEVQVHYEGIHRIDPESGERGEVVDEMQEAVVQCLECMHDQPHLGFHNGRVEPIEDRWERMIAGTPWVASCTVTVDSDDVETCSGPDAGDALSYAAFGDHGTREFFTHVRFHKHDEDRIVVHLLVELYARSAEEATDVLEEAARGTLAITSLAEESRPPASTADDTTSALTERPSKKIQPDHERARSGPSPAVR